VGTRGTRGPWCLAVRVPHQAIWKPVAPGDLCVVTSDINEARVLCL